MSDWIFAAIMIGALLVPSALFGQWWLFSVFAVFGICFGFIEWLAVKRTGKTVSQHFWKFSESHKVKAIIILVGMLIAWLALLFHLSKGIF